MFGKFLPVKNSSSNSSATAPLTWFGIMSSYILDDPMRREVVASIEEYEPSGPSDPRHHGAAP